jgi:hypothetical protein
LFRASWLSFWSWGTKSYLQTAWEWAYVEIPSDPSTEVNMLRRQRHKY